MNVLKLVTTVPPSTESFEEITPAPGKIVSIYEFVSSLPTGAKLSAKIIWKFNHSTETEEVLWVTHDQGQMPVHDVRIDNCDGVRKLAVTIDNPDLIEKSAAALIKYKVE